MALALGPTAITRSRTRGGRSFPLSLPCSHQRLFFSHVTILENGTHRRVERPGDRERGGVVRISSSTPLGSGTRDREADYHLVAPRAPVRVTYRPVIAGNCAVLLFAGVLLTVFGNFVGSTGWARSSQTLKATLVVVTLLGLASTGLGVHDILYSSTILSADVAVYQLGTAPQAFEPLLAGVIATICQVVLTLRASSIIRSPVVRWSYICILMSGSLMGLLGSMGMAGTHALLSLTEAGARADRPGPSLVRLRSHLVLVPRRRLQRSSGNPQSHQLHFNLLVNFPVSCPGDSVW